MNLIVNEGQTKISLFGNTELITDEIVSELFNRKITHDDFEINNLQFNKYGTETDNKFMFIVKETEKSFNDKFSDFVDGIEGHLLNRELTVYEMDNLIKEQYNWDIETTNCWDFIMDGEISEYLKANSYTYTGLGMDKDLTVDFNLVDTNEDLGKSIIKITRVY